DQDCTDVSLDLPCLHSCESVPRSKADSSALSEAIAGVARNYCDPAPSGCAAHAVSCTPTTDKTVCYQGTCTRLNLETSGCIDECSCMAERTAAFAVYRGDCAGPDLWVAASQDCRSCGPGGAWFVIGNRGDAEF